MSDLTVTGLRGLPELRAGDDLAGLLVAAAQRAAGGLREGDVVCVAQKAVSKVEGRSVELASVDEDALGEAMTLAWQNARQQTIKKRAAGGAKPGRFTTRSRGR